MAKTKSSTPKKAMKTTTSRATKSPSPGKRKTRASPRKATPSAGKAESLEPDTTRSGRVTKVSSAKKTTASAKKTAASPKNPTASAKKTVGSTKRMTPLTKKPATSKVASTTTRVPTKAASAASKLLSAATNAGKESAPKPRGRPRKTPPAEQASQADLMDSPRKKTVSKSKKAKTEPAVDDGTLDDYLIPYGDDEVVESIEASTAPRRAAPKKAVGRPKGSTRSPSKSPAKSLASKAVKSPIKHLARSATASPKKATSRTPSKSPSKTEINRPVRDRSRNPAKRVAKPAKRSPNKSPAATTRQTRLRSPAKSTITAKGTEAQYLDGTDNLWDGASYGKIEAATKPTRAESPARKTTTSAKRSPSKSPALGTARIRSQSPAKTASKTTQRDHSKNLRKQGIATQRTEAQYLDCTDDWWDGPPEVPFVDAAGRTHSKSPVKPAVKSNSAQRSPSKSPSVTSARARFKSPKKAVAQSPQRSPSKPSAAATTRARSKSPFKQAVKSPQRSPSKSSVTATTRARSKSPAKRKPSDSTYVDTGGSAHMPDGRDVFDGNNDWIPLNSPKHAKKPVGRPRKGSQSPKKTGAYAVPDGDVVDGDIGETVYDEPTGQRGSWPGIADTDIVPADYAAPRQRHSASPAQRKPSSTTRTATARRSASPAKDRRASPEARVQPSFGHNNRTYTRPWPFEESFSKRGSIISPTNPEYIGDTGKRNPFHERMPAEEVWHRNMPRRFDYGDTPFMEKYKSDEIDLDLAGSMNDKRSDSRTSLLGRLGDGLKSAFGFTQSAPDAPQYPPPWDLPDLTEEEEEEVNRIADEAVRNGPVKLKSVSSGFGGPRKRLRAEDLNDDDDIVMSGGLGGMH